VHRPAANEIHPRRGLQPLGRYSLKASGHTRAGSAEEAGWIRLSCRFSYWCGVATLVARSRDSRSIYDARLSDVEMQERQRRRETRASAHKQSRPRTLLRTTSICARLPLTQTMKMFKAAALRRQGLEVFEAADVAEAVTVLKKIAVDLLISGISLIDGTVLAQLAKEHQPTTQLVWTLESRQNAVGTATLH